MAYSDNQLSPHKQKTEGRVRKVTGLWEKVAYDKKGRAFVLLKSGRLNVQGWINLQVHGEDTLLLIVPNMRRTRKNDAPQYWLYACKDYASENPADRKDDPESKK